jgi:ABC-2 type transport system ATP-binding protein
MHLIEAQDLTRKVDGQQLLHNVSLKVKSDELTGVLGPNGSGKTTLLSMLATVSAPTSGEIRYFGETTTNYPAIRNRIGYVSDSIAHYGDLTGYENALMFAGLYGVEKQVAKKRIDELFDHFELAPDANKQVKRYSFGMKRKLTIIESLLHEPEILIMDEPTIGLDYISENKMHDLLKEKSASGMCVLVSTNNIREAESICDRVVFMHKGRIVADEAPRKLIEDLGDMRTINIELAEPIRLIPTSEKFKISVNSDGTLITAVADRNPQSIIEISGACVKAGGDIKKIEVADTDLGAVFTNIVGEAIRW